MLKNKSLFVTLLVLLALVFVACSPAADDTADTGGDDTAADTTTDDTAADDTTDDAADDTSDDAPTGDKVEIRWFVGLGAGSDEPTFAAQEAVVEKFNASQDEIELVLEIIDNSVAYDTLATQIAAGNAPDIVGPTGIRGRDSFKGAWLDLQPLIDSTGYDLSDFDPSMVEFYFVKEEGQLGLPFAVFPSFIQYNVELFDEAGIPYPPQNYGDPYIDIDGNEKEWNIETMSELAMLLTVDANGNDATSPDFDKSDIVQFGYGETWADARGLGTLFGAGSLVADDGTAQIPEQWAEAWKWWYDAAWEKGFYPTGPYGNSDLLGAGNWFESGNLAMAHSHLWYIACCLGNLDAAWDTAVVPSYDGSVTAKMHADTFGIPKATENPEAAFKVLSYLLDEAAPDLLAIYGGMPARLSLQEGYFETTFPQFEVNWDVVVAGMSYVDNPNHENYMPSFQETNDKYNEYFNKWNETPGLDLDAEFEALVEELNRIFAAAGE